MALLGVGQVGRALLDDLARRPLDGARITAAGDSAGGLWDPDGLDVSALLEAKRDGGRLPDPSPLADAVRAGDVDVLVDLSPTDLATAEPARSWHRTCLKAGVAVVTANKGPLAVEPSIRDRFEDRGVPYRAEATVGGGLPVLSTIRRLRAGDRIEAIDAVPNGATTRVLSAVADGQGFDEAVDACRRAGVLEADPALDLGGGDAAAKAAILARAAFDVPARIDDVATEGIEDLSTDDVRWAASRGRTHRLVASIRPDRIEVRPAALDQDAALAAPGQGNVYAIRLARGGTVHLAGPGAGPGPTASAVRRDLEKVTDAPDRVTRRPAARPA